MQLGVTDLDQLSQVISHATAPVFLLGAVAGFVSILIARMSGVIDRVRSLNMISDDDAARAHPKADIPRLKHRARLMNDAIYLSVGSGICITVLVILAFASALVGIRHEFLVGVLFVIALGCWARRCSTSRVRCGSRSTNSTTIHECYGNLAARNNLPLLDLPCRVRFSASCAARQVNNATAQVEGGGA